MTSILYESDEWSTYALRDYIRGLGEDAILIDMEKDIPYDTLKNCDLAVNRVFASAQFRGHQKSLEKLGTVYTFLKSHNIPMANSYQAHLYETSKELSTNTLAAHGICVPKIYGTFCKEGIYRLPFTCPLILKPDCGGRTTETYIVKDPDELTQIVPKLSNITMLAEEYIEPAYGWLTRIEVIGGECRLIVKRSVAENGLSAYRFGSAYERYDDCAEMIRRTAVRAMELLEIEFGSMDIIETKNSFYIIDINAVSNASEDNTEMFQFDLMKETAAYIVKKLRNNN